MAKFANRSSSEDVAAAAKGKHITSRGTIENTIFSKIQEKEMYDYITHSIGWFENTPST